MKGQYFTPLYVPLRCECWPKWWGVWSWVMGAVTQMSGIQWEPSVHQQRHCEVPYIYNSSLSWSIIRDLSHWLGYPVTLVLLLLHCFLLYLHLSRPFFLSFFFGLFVLLLCSPPHWLVVRKMAALTTASSSEAIISSTTPSCEVSSWATLNYGPFNKLWRIGTFWTLMMSAISNSNSSR